MKSISIKSFIFSLILSLLLAESAIFYSFYQNFRSNVSVIIQENLQSNILNLKHFLEKNLHVDDVSDAVAHLDNFVSTNQLIEDIEIFDRNSKLVYSTNRLPLLEKNQTECKHISEIPNEDIFKASCYEFSIRLFSGLTPYYYKTTIYMDKEFLNSILLDEAKKYIAIFVLFSVVFVALLWLLLQYFLITPLELLRQYAYYNRSEAPKKFLISEIESVRYSFFITFERLRAEQKELFKLSTQDPLSGLNNRHSLIEKVNWLIAKSKREKVKFALIFFDLDDFKNINDYHGHETGDIILKQVSKLLLSTIRENDFVSRFGGDEFVIVLTDLTEDTQVVDVVERIKNELSKPIIHNGIEYHVTASMGITIFPRDGRDFSTLLKHADIAMYKSKELGKNHYHFFTESLNESIQEKVYLQKLMQEGLQHNYFKLYYQPKVDIATGKIVSCEALIRLFDPHAGLIPPFKFIPVAEQNNLIIPIGRWVIKEAVEQIKRWEGTVFEGMSISINVSAIQFRDSNFTSYLKETIQDIDKTKLDIELTESVLMTDYDKNLKIIHQIKELGLSLSLDDFGTGYSSLSYLKNIPFDTLKIDKSFIDDITKDPKDKAFIKVIISIAKNLNMKVVAEGVEEEEQLELLHEFKCHMYQGYLCSPPLPTKEFEEMTQKYHQKLS